jgi:hypothetical protein
MEIGGCELGINSCGQYQTAVWAPPVSFHVAVSGGAGLAVWSRSDVVIADTIFVNNQAARGNAVDAISLQRLAIANTTFSDLDNDVFTLGVQVSNCVQNPCTPGQRCSFLEHSTLCSRCATNEFGDGLACEACPTGMEPDHKQTFCVPCPPGTESQIGLCTTGPAGKVGVNGACNSCPGTNQEPMDGATRCQCQAGFYNSSYGMVQCPGQSQPTQRGLLCQPCGDCLDCKLEDGAHIVLIRSGFALGPAAATAYQGIEQGQLHNDKVLHTCTRNMCTGETTGFALHLTM